MPHSMICCTIRSSSSSSIVLRRISELRYMLTEDVNAGYVLPSIETARAKI
jgi:hypothetical protein